MHYLIKISLCLCALLSGTYVKAQSNSTERLKKASRKVEKGYTKANSDTLAQGYYDLGKEYADKGEFKKSEAYYQQAKNLFVKNNDAAGVAKASRALASVQEELGKTVAAEKNYDIAKTKALNRAISHQRYSTRMT